MSTSRIVVWPWCDSLLFLTPIDHTSLSALSPPFRASIFAIDNKLARSDLTGASDDGRLWLGPWGRVVRICHWAQHHGNSQPPGAPEVRELCRAPASRPLTFKTAQGSSLKHFRTHSLCGADSLVRLVCENSIITADKARHSC